MTTDALDRRETADDLGALVEGVVRFGRHDRMLYATDASIYQVEPLGVVIPASIEDVQRVVVYCAKHALPILPRGGGTSLAGQAVARAVVVDLSVSCGRLLALEAGARSATVEPGLVLDRLNEAAAPCGLMFGPDVATSAQATLGGMIGNNSAGAHSILYGRTVEHLDGVDVLLADGTRLTLARGAADTDQRVATLTRRVADVVRPLASEIRSRYPKTTRRVNGYNLDLVLDQLERSRPGGFDQVNLAHLLCGAEGTLGLVTGARLRLVDAPRHKGLAIVALPGVDEAIEALRAILETGPAAVELIDDVIISLARRNKECRRSIDLLPVLRADAPGAVLYVEYFGDDQAAVEACLDELTRRVAPAPVNCYTEPGAMEAAWKLRRAGEPLLHAMPGHRKPLTFIEDTAVDPRALAEFVAAFRAIVAAHGTTAAYYAHASVGCLHIRPMIALREPADRAAMEAIAIEVTDLVRSFGGALSGEHGDGRARSHLLRRFYGDAICDAFAAIKAIFDPDNRMNPGNIVDPAPMTRALRVDSGRAPAVRTYFRYEAEHGFESALEMCNGAGVCRKRKGGTMCPSYRALLDERHATRGRGNALRLAITGQLSADGRTPAWDDAETIETLDLCLSCKACKAECPSSVDVARLKAEYTAQRFAATGRVPLRTRVFGRVRRLNRLGSAIHPLANALARFGPTSATLRLTLGIDRRRSLPPLGQSLYRWIEKRASPRGDGDPVVVLLPDCFTTYSEPQTGRAAVEVLERLGYRVVLPTAGCCGRSLISTGMLGEAQSECRATAEALIRCVARHDAVAVVGCEPSCVSAITDDWTDLDIDLDPGTVCDLAERTCLVEHFIESHWDRHPIAPRPSPWTGAEVLLHGHCHEKALWGMQPTTTLLRRLLGGSLHVIEAGCCGMAGAFGYTTDHYDLSMAIGELDLFPALREQPQATILAPGTSCRHQIRDATARRALHPIEVIERILQVPA